jgi:hypothetical protein
MRNSATVDKRMAGVEEMREVVMRPGELVPVRIEGKDQPLSTGSEVYSGKVPKGPEDLDQDDDTKYTKDSSTVEL